MNHDLDHCRGLDCSIREHCLRYLAHLDAEEKGMTVYYNDKKDDGGHCDEFIYYDEFML